MQRGAGVQLAHRALRMPLRKHPRRPRSDAAVRVRAAFAAVFQKHRRTARVVPKSPAPHRSVARRDNHVPPHDEARDRLCTECAPAGGPFVYAGAGQEVQADGV